MEVIFRKSFQKRFKKLPTKIQNQFSRRLDLFLRNKFDQALNNHSVDPTFPNCNSINVTGDYRAIFMENDDVAIFLMIGTHSELY